MNYWDIQDGLPFPYGATWNDTLQGFNFALYSKAASKLELFFFKKADPFQIVFSFLFDPVKNKTSTIWHCFIPETSLNGADCYAYRVDGSNDPGNHFNYQKLLTDPWAKSIYFPTTYSRQAAISAGDNIGKAALGLLIRNDTSPPDFGNDINPRHYHDLIIYEIHVVGFTMDESSGVSSQNRGTFAGIVDMIPYLKELGVTAVELMPIFQFDPQGNNYWGYMTMNFFAPHHLFGASSDPWDLVKEFKAMVQALHKENIEVILDVVYNHSAEEGDGGPMFSFKGIDNASYYLLTSDLKQYINDAGTGNVLRSSHKVVRKLILDSLRYWVTEMHVDGFRFDLASIFTRNEDASVNLSNPPILEEISMDPVLANVRLIAEPWDITSYQLGHRFPGAAWAQWNGAYRDDLRRFIKGDENMVANVMSRIYGSQDLFPDYLPFTNKPWQSINFITSHDGFTLYDLVSYNVKHNEANGFNNSDGANDNFSWNCGWEGDINLPPSILELRKKLAKNFMVLLMFSNGIPMFRMGDEFLHTQQGNNNPFNQNNTISWLDWTRKNKFDDFFRFTKMLISLRKNHPSLCRGIFWYNDISWYNTAGDAADISYYSRTLSYYINGASVEDDDFFVMINSYWEPIYFTLPLSMTGWKVIINTALHSPNDIDIFTNSPTITSPQLLVQDRSVLVLQKV